MPFEKGKRKEIGVFGMFVKILRKNRLFVREHSIQSSRVEEEEES